MAEQKESCRVTTQKILRKHLEDRFWRLNNLYYILDQQGKQVLFKMNMVQYALYIALWWLNIIPKSRQHGITTFIGIFILDACLFNPDVRAGIIAHKLPDAKKIFQDKVKYPYDHLPDDLKTAVFLTKDDSQEVRFANNSSIFVGTSMRSGTLQYLHVSEYGWICTHAPKKAAEIKAGAMETLHEGSITFVESTFEGPYGDFPDMCDIAEKIRLSGKELGPLDYKIHFFPWWKKASNVTDPKYVEISLEMHSYFDKAEQACKTTLTLPQRAWYTGKKKILKHLMFKEHPTTLEEAKRAGIEGAYYTLDMSRMYEESRVCKVPYLDAYPVHTVCDLGIGFNMPWIFFQVVGLECHIINEFNLGKKSDIKGGASFYHRMLESKRQQFNYIYGKHFCPFDVNKGEIGTGQEIYKTFKQQGITFQILKKETNVDDGIQRMKNWFPVFYIDMDNCPNIINSWSCYHQNWIENLQRFDTKPANDQYAHFADAGRYLSEVLEKKLYLMDEKPSNTQTVAELEYSSLN